MTSRSNRGWGKSLFVSAALAVGTAGTVVMVVEYAANARAQESDANPQDDSPQRSVGGSARAGGSVGRSIEPNSPARSGLGLEEGRVPADADPELTRSDVLRGLAELEDNAQLDLSGLDVVIDRGQVVIEGEIDTLQELLSVRQALAGLERGRFVTTRIDLAGAGVADPTLASDVELVIDRNPAFAGVSFVVKDGVVTFRGSVRSDEVRQELLAATRALAGVRAIQDRVGVLGVTSDPDLRIETDLDALFSSDPLLSDQNLVVDVRNGVVVIEGNVESEQIRQTLTRRAFIAGVRSVDVSGVTVLDGSSTTGRVGRPR